MACKHTQNSSYCG